MWREWGRDMTKLMVAFGSFVKAPEMQLALCGENILSDIERRISIF
jgi:hypothetical protein